jgi:hypothetical protein
MPDQGECKGCKVKGDKKAKERGSRFGVTTPVSQAKTNLAMKNGSNFIGQH